MLAAAALLFFGCAAAPPSGPPTLPAGEVLEQNGDTLQGWWKTRFRFHWPRGERPRWAMDLLIADRVVRPVLMAHRKDIALWRFHRRAARDAAGHQFSFIFFADRQAAARLLSDLEKSPLLAVLHDAGLLESILFDSPDKTPEADPSATSDPTWSKALRGAWPYYIMGVSAMWLALIDETADDRSPPQTSAAPLLAHYRELNRRVTEIWETEAQHAMLHHLNAIFGYRPTIIQKRMRF